VHRNFGHKNIGHRVEATKVLKAIESDGPWCRSARFPRVLAVASHNGPRDEFPQFPQALRQFSPSDLMLPSNAQ
jgi:hypothetical protein